MRRSYEKNRHKYVEKSREHYRANGARARQEWREANRERDREAVRRNHAKHRLEYRAAARARYAANPQPAKDQARAWGRANPRKRSVIMAFQNAKRRSRKKANGGRGFTKTHWRTLVARVGGLCAYCRLESVGSIDHFVPIAQGGADDFANIVPSCCRCNSTKRANDPERWVLEHFGAERLEYIRSIMLE